jgi:uncharacterized protein (TIGR02266 family)
MRENPVAKRRFRRRTVRVLVDYATDGEVRCEYATTLGAGGMFIESESPLPRGAQVKVRFRLPSAGTVHEIEARVAWTQEADAGSTRGAPGMGIEFTDAVATATLARSLEK